MKKLISLTVLAALFGSVAYANGPDQKSKNPCMKPGKVLTKDVDLTEDQRVLAEDVKTLRKGHKAERHELKRSMKQDRIDTLKGYAEGDLSRSQINARIERKHTEMVDHHSDMQDGFFALIDSYSEVQKDQVRDNIEDTRQCMADNEEQFETHIARKEAHIQKRMEKKAEFMSKDLDLSRTQQAAFDTWQEGQKQKIQERIDKRMDDKGENLETLLDGMSKGDIERRQRAESTERIDLMQEQVGLMMDFVDSLDEDQRDQFVENIDALVERAQNRQKREGKGQKGQAKPSR
jgi:hypothetical protein